MIVDIIATERILSIFIYRMTGILDRLNIPHQFYTSPGAPHSVKEVLACLDTDAFEFNSHRLHPVQVDSN
jgi:hypothetical protein